MEHSARFNAGSLSKDYPRPQGVPENAFLVVVHKNEICLRTGCDPTIFMPTSKEITESLEDSIQYLGNLGTVPCYVLDIPEEDYCSEGVAWYGVRDLDDKIPDEELAIAGLAVHIADYNRTTQFCGRCGTRTLSSQTERAKICPSCHYVTYARISPAIIVLVRKDENILLVRGKQAPAGRFSLVAGFVEPGETIEHAVHREVREETGIEISHVRYLASEPWPFPNSLMIGFVADYAGGTFKPDGIEIESAGWFDRNNLPDFPQKISITHALIDRWTSEKLPEYEY
jgi:NAD+ diphosphatase